MIEYLFINKYIDDNIDKVNTELDKFSKWLAT